MIKNEKGVTLLALTITIIVMVIITGTLIYNANNQLHIKKIDNLYSDIEQIRDKVSQYYIKYGKLPVKGRYCTANELVEILKQNGADSSKTQEDLLDINDKKSPTELTYYVIDLSKLDNLTLYYGSKFSTWTPNVEINEGTGEETYSSSTTEQDLYIINEKSQQIYYPKGITVENKFYYAHNIDLNASNSAELEVVNISEIVLSRAVFEDASADGKIHVAKDSEISIKAAFSVKVPNNNNIANVFYAFKKKTNTNEDLTSPEKFEKCNSLSEIVDDGDANNKTYQVNLISQKMGTETYYLWVRIQDENGNEVITNKSINPDNQLENNITNEIQLVNEEIELTTESSTPGQVEVKIKYNPNSLENIAYGEGDTVENAKSNVNAIPGNAEYETDENGNRIYTLVVTREEYVFVVAGDGFGNYISAYIGVNVPVTVTFMNGTATYATENTIAGSTISNWPTNPTNGTAEFEGWFDAQTGGTQYAYDTIINADTTLYARWQVQTLSPSSTVNASTSFATDKGVIDVIWLSENTNTPTTTANTPNIQNGMKPVTWNLSGTSWGNPVQWSWDSGESKWKLDSISQTEWYNYKSTTYNGAMANQWANVVDPAGSYFVWIPRFAYRITYYAASDTTNSDPTGYYDGFGMWNAKTKEIKNSYSNEITAVVYDGKSYIVHNAFLTNVANGGGFGTATSSVDGIKGFWVAKYEMSRETKSGNNWIKDSTRTGNNATSSTLRAVSKPNVESWRSINIANCYTNSRNYGAHSYGSTSVNSHLMKNSEWGAVAYLAHSQYGLNGNNIAINNSSSYITGTSGGTSDASSSDSTYAYNDNANGVKASTTGNVYGIYDLSGGAYEYVAAFNRNYSAGSTNYFTADSYKDASGNHFASNGGSSDAYATAYSNSSATNFGPTLYSVGITGDATKEVYKGSSYYNWNSDYSYFVYSSSPFFIRGGYYSVTSRAGLFYSNSRSGIANSNYSFRVVLAF